jgi:hypothetical protein
MEELKMKTVYLNWTLKSLNWRGAMGIMRGMRRMGQIHKTKTGPAQRDSGISILGRSLGRQFPVKRLADIFFQRKFTCYIRNPVVMKF